MSDEQEKKADPYALYKAYYLQLAEQFSDRLWVTGRRVVVLPFPREEGLTGYREFYGTLVWDATTPEHPIGLQTIKGSTQQADLWFKAGTEGEVLE